MAKGPCYCITFPVRQYVGITAALEVRVKNRLIRVITFIHTKEVFPGGAVSVTRFRATLRFWFSSRGHEVDLAGVSFSAAPPSQWVWRLNEKKGKSFVTETFVLHQRRRTTEEAGPQWGID